MKELDEPSQTVDKRTLLRTPRRDPCCQYQVSWSPCWSLLGEVVFGNLEGGFSDDGSMQMPVSRQFSKIMFSLGYLLRFSQNLMDGSECARTVHVRKENGVGAV